MAKRDRRRDIFFCAPGQIEINKVLDRLAKEGQKKGHWVLEAVRQRMQREGLLPAKKGA